MRTSMGAESACVQVAMSLPGDRDAQRMLLGEQPLSKGRPLRPLGSAAGRDGRSTPTRSESLPGTSHQKHLERKADPGIGRCPRRLGLHGQTSGRTMKQGHDCWFWIVDAPFIYLRLRSACH